MPETVQHKLGSRAFRIAPKLVGNKHYVLKMQQSDQLYVIFAG